MKTLISQQEIEDMRQNKIDFAYEIFERTHNFIHARGIRECLARLGSLPVGYRTIYSTLAVEGEICNGGFYQYYGNSTAQDFNDLAIAGFTRIGATTSAAVLRLVFQEILSQSPTFRNEHQTIGVQYAFNKATDDYEEVKIDFDDVFYAAIEDENITQRRLDYIINNYAEFLTP